MADNLLNKLYYYKARLLKVIDSNSLKLEVDLGFDSYYICEVRFSETFGSDIHSQDTKIRQLGLMTKDRIQELFLSAGNKCIIHSTKRINHNVRHTQIFLLQNGKYINLEYQLLSEKLVDYILDSDKDFTKE